jgi:hypothetical protein
MTVTLVYKEARNDVPRPEGATATFLQKSCLAFFYILTGSQIFNLKSHPFVLYIWSLYTQQEGSAIAGSVLFSNFQKCFTLNVWAIFSMQYYWRPEMFEVWKFYSWHWTSIPNNGSFSFLGIVLANTAQKSCSFLNVIGDLLKKKKNHIKLLTFPIDLLSSCSYIVIVSETLQPFEHGSVWQS